MEIRCGLSLNVLDARQIVLFFIGRPLRRPTRKVLLKNTLRVNPRSGAASEFPL